MSEIDDEKINSGTAADAADGVGFAGANSAAEKPTSFSHTGEGAKPQTTQKLPAKPKNKSDETKAKPAKKQTAIIEIYDEDEEVLQKNDIIIFEDTDESPDDNVVVFEDVDDTYLNQVGLVDQRVEMLRRRSGVEVGENPVEPQASLTSGVVEFIDTDEEELGKDYLDADADTLIKKLIAQSNKRAKAKEAPDVTGHEMILPPSYLDTAKKEQNKQLKAEIDGLIKQAGSDALLGSLYNAISSGKNSIIHSRRSESVVLDDQWITTIEEGLFFIEEIIKNPRKFIIDNEIILEVERAKKINSKTVRHLAQNTRNISHIEDDGFVMPKRVLTTEMDENLAIYENRFVCTLVNRLISFTEIRKTEIEGKFRIYDIAQVAMKSQFKYGGSTVECNFSVAVKEPPRSNFQLEKAMVLVEKISNISKRLRILKNSFFMRKLSALKPLMPPIQKTNIIKMNVNYATAYKLWLYISAYNFLGYSVEVTEKRLPVDGSYFEDLAAIASLSMRSVIQHEVVNREQYAKVAALPPKSSKYKVVSDFELASNVNETDANEATANAKDATIVEVKDEALNEYYFRKMQELMEEKASTPIEAEEYDGENSEEEIAEEKVNAKNIIVEKKMIEINYERMCKSLLRISNDVLSDTLKKESEKLPLVHPDAVMRKRSEYIRQKNLVKKYNILSKLKADDLEKARNEEAVAENKLEKLARELENLEARDKSGTSRSKKTKKDITFERAAQFIEGTPGEE